jgi:putative endonuclease
VLDRIDTGKRGEALALNYLKHHGYRILETNFRTRYGEIDIIGRKKDYLVFFEVRAKKNLSYGLPEESISAAKASHLRAAAYYFIRTHSNLPESWRIDFIAIELDDKMNAKRIEVIESAVEDG